MPDKIQQEEGRKEGFILATTSRIELGSHGGRTLRQLMIL